MAIAQWAPVMWLALLLLTPLVDDLPDPASIVAESPGETLLTPDQPSQETTRGAPRWFVRVSLGGMSTFASEHKRLLELDGFDMGTKFAFQADLGMRVTNWLAVGPWFGLTYQHNQPTSSSPTLHETAGQFGVQTPLMFPSETVVLMVSPRVGMGWLNLALSGDGDTKKSMAFGGEVGLFLQRFPLGFALGALSVPFDMGGVGRSYNAGGVYFLVSGAFHG